MARSSAPDDDELSKLFEGIPGAGGEPADDAALAAGSASVGTGGGGAGGGGAIDASAPQAEHDLLAELGSLAAERPVSRSTTPRPQQPPQQQQQRQQQPLLSSLASRARNATAAAAASDAPTAVPQSGGAGAAATATPDTVAAAVPQRAESGGGGGGSEGRAGKGGAGSTVEESTAAAAPTRDGGSSSSAGTTSGGGGRGGGGGGWWGGLLATATAAVKTAEAAVKEIQQHDETRRWTEQVKENVGALRGLGDEIRSRALPTVTNLLHTLAPPISAHERLQIHVTHDFVGYPSLQHLTYDVFARVMAQVEGGDLVVVQRGQEPASQQHHRRASSLASSSSSAAAAAAADGRQRNYVAGGWRDGPWWRQPLLLPGEQRSLSMVRGGVEGAKLARASAESYAADFYAPYGGVGAAARKATEGMTESNPVRNSHVFLAVQAVVLSAGGAHEALAAEHRQQQQQQESHRRRGRRSSSSSTAAGRDAEQLVSFAICLHDPEHRIDYSTFSQSFPLQWAQWLDASSASASASAATPDSASSADGEGDADDSAHSAGQATTAEDDDKGNDDEGSGGRRGGAGGRAARGAPRPHQQQQRPAEIDKIIQQGGADPREWVAEWIEEIISLGVAVVAQRYVARRMGIGGSPASDDDNDDSDAHADAAADDRGAGARARVAPRQQALESGGGEAARAI